MRNLILFSLFFFVSFSSCTQEKVDIQKALEFYEAINYQIGLKVAQQQKCIDELTKAILIVKENDDSLINTKGLEVLLKISTSINFAKKNSIENLTEFDTEINLKKKHLIIILLSLVLTKTNFHNSFIFYQYQVKTDLRDYTISYFLNSN